MIIAVPRETYRGERRVALVPATVATLVKDGLEVHVEHDAGNESGFSDEQYAQRGAEIIDDRAQLLSSADIVVQVRSPGSNTDAAEADLHSLRSGQLVIGHADPLTPAPILKSLAERGVTLLAMELIPRITRAQGMDALSSQANLAGYASVIHAAAILPKIIPMMMTAAGTLQPAKVFIIGAGVAGLQAIATAKRLGAVVSAFDVRPVVKEQVESLGAKFVQLPLETRDAEDKSGYAKEQSPEQVRKQQELMARTVAESDVVITTALIPGRKAPTLVTADMVERMTAGSVVVDLAAERGGNCELTQPGKTIQHNGVTIVGEENLANSVPAHASQMYSGNVFHLLRHLIKKGELKLDFSDEITSSITVCHDGQIVHPRVREALNLAPLEPSPAMESKTP